MVIKSKQTISLFSIAFFTCLALATHSKGLGKERRVRNWLCYYGTTFGYEVYSRFDLVVLDGFFHPPLKKNRQGRPIILGYLSVGEVDVEGPFWPLAQGKPFLVKKNDFWNSWIIDIRDASWQNILFQTAIPSIFDQGFDGLFLDTMDSSLSLEEDSKAFAGTGTALSEIIKGIRNEYPEKVIAINRCLPLLPDFSPLIDYVVIEDLYSYYAGEKKGYVKVGRETREHLLDQAQKGLKANPDLKVLTLDYAPNGAIGLAKEAVTYSRKNGFIPYVSTYELNQIFFYALDP